MPFRVAARTILELGSELISSDAIALYELIKNAIDAGSESGVDIEYVITLTKKNYIELLEEFDDDEESSIADWVDIVLEGLEADALDEHREAIKELLNEADDWDDVKDAIEIAYAERSYIEIRDEGCGMSLADLKDAFLTIGTPKRFRELQSSFDDSNATEPGVLGEKGIGRLSAMRLGERLHVLTSTEGGKYVNELKIDWSDFAENLDAMIEDIPVDPRRGAKKIDDQHHGTTLRITKLEATWSKSRLEQLAGKQLARITDPFSAKKRQFGIYLGYNEERVHFVRTVRKILFEQAHATLSGRYRIDAAGEPQLTLSTTVPLFGRGKQTERYDYENLFSSAGEQLGDIPHSALIELGPFDFDLYWFNRQRIKKPPGFETRNQFRDLVQAWSGIMLYRDGYQVLPYGDEDTDWLELDRKALASGGYKLNKAQFVGRVSISRIRNRNLIDQTNREGLHDCDDKAALIGLLQFAIRDRLKQILEECDLAEKRSMNLPEDPTFRKREVDELTKRARRTIKQVEPKGDEGRLLLKQVFDMFGDLEIKYRAVERRLEATEDEHERLVDLAGVGLIIESLAHELTRSVEHAADLLATQKKHGLPPEMRSFFTTLKSSMDSITKRLKIIDPLSPSGRQRRRNLDLRKIVDTLIEGHQAQFERHDIKVTVLPKKAKSVKLYAVEGRIIQILENLLSNSVYWLKAQRQLRKNMRREIAIEVFDNGAPGFRFTDTGPGIPLERREQVFQPFFSTKPKKSRQGLGLYIARECAMFHGGTVELDESDINERGNLRTFVVELPDSRKK